MDAESALVLHGVTKRFGGLAVCDNIDFTVPAGARMALIGPNGAGKTTLFNLISGVYPIDSGSISLHGQPIHHLPPRNRVRAGLARSFQNIRLMPHLSAIENIMLGQHTLASGIGSMLSPLAWQRIVHGASRPKKACARPVSTSTRTRPSAVFLTACARKSKLSER